MKIKRIGLVLLMVALGAGNIFARDTGDLMLNMGLLGGIGFNEIGIRLNGLNINNIPGIAVDDKLDPQVAILGSFDYYLTNFLGVSAGLGVMAKFPLIDITEYGATINIVFVNTYASIPIGACLSLSVLSLGGGFTANIPLFYMANYTAKAGSGSGSIRESVRDSGYKSDFYMGWYFDIGFDMSGLPERDSGSGVFVRLEGSFSDQVAGTNWINNGVRVEYRPYFYFSTSIVFRNSRKIGSYPIWQAKP